MKTKIQKFILIAGLLLCNSAINAQNWAQKDSKIVKDLVDTTLLHAMEVTIMPGEKGQEHTHPAHFFYALTDCNLIVHYSDGKTEKFNLKAGESGFGSPERPHRTENAGKKPAKFLLIELKEHPYIAGSK
jgi:quercetin dioxygenase-like cupin family protein